MVCVLLRGSYRKQNAFSEIKLFFFTFFHQFKFIFHIKFSVQNILVVLHYWKKYKYYNIIKKKRIILSMKMNIRVKSNSTSET